MSMWICKQYTNYKKYSYDSGGTLVVGSSIRGYHSTRGVGKQSFTYNCAMSINGFFFLLWL